MAAVPYEECKCHECTKWRNYARALKDPTVPEAMKVHIEGMFSTQNPYLPPDLPWKKR